MGKIAKLFLFSSTLQLLYSAEPTYSTSNIKYFEFDYLPGAINLEKNLTSNSNCINIELNEKGPFQYNIVKSYSVSLGIGQSFWFPDAGQWAVIGLAPNKSSYVSFFGVADTKDKLDSVKSRKLPKNHQKLDGWIKGDAAFWDSAGGVAFNIGTGIVPFHAGTTFVAKGSWSHYVEKTGDNTVYVGVTKRKIRNISLSAGVSYLGASATKISESADGLSYELDLSTPEVQEAYNDLVKGKFTTVQDLESQEHPGVTKIADISKFKKGYTNSFGSGTPYMPLISFSSNRERSYEGELQEFAWEASDDLHQGIYAKEFRYRIIGLHHKSRMSFHGGEELKKSMDWDTGNQIEKLNSFAKFNYHYEADFGRDNKLSRAISKFFKRTNLEDFVCVNIPDIDDSLSYHQIKLDIEWSDSMTKSFIKDGLNWSEISKTFKSKDRKILKKIQKLQSELSLSNKKEDIANSWSKIGKLIWSSEDIFKLFFEIGINCDQTATFEISGLELSRIQKNLNGIKSNNCLLK